jgi:hypothetical protein
LALADARKSLPANFDEKLIASDQALHFPGQPNRRRPKDYVNALVREGWTDVVVRPVSVASPSYSKWAREGLDSEFRDDDRDMHILTCFVAAKRQR